MASLPLLGLALLAWTVTLLAMGAALGMLARSFGELSAGFDVSGMILSSLGGALVPLAAMPRWIRSAAPVSPGYWAVSGLRAALQGQVMGTCRAAAVLAGFALAFGLAAALRMRRGWGRSARM